MAAAALPDGVALVGDNALTCRFLRNSLSAADTE
jgi:hypothetical protein